MRSKRKERGRSGRKTKEVGVEEEEEEERRTTTRKEEEEANR